MNARQRRAANDAEVRGWLLSFLRAYMRILRGLLKGRAPARSPCHTCALNPSTDGWVGFELTATKLMDSFENGTPFVCHEGMPRDPTTRQWFIDPRRPLPPLCAAYEALRDEPAVHRAPMRAVRCIGPAPASIRDVRAPRPASRG